MEEDQVTTRDPPVKHAKSWFFISSSGLTTEAFLVAKESIQTATGVSLDNCSYLWCEIKILEGFHYEDFKTVQMLSNNFAAFWKVSTTGRAVSATTGAWKLTAGPRPSLRWRCKRFNSLTIFFNYFTVFNLAEKRWRWETSGILWPPSTRFQCLATASTPTPNSGCGHTATATTPTRRTRRRSSSWPSMPATHSSKSTAPSLTQSTQLTYVSQNLGVNNKIIHKKLHQNILRYCIPNFRPCCWSLWWLVQGRFRLQVFHLWLNV